VISGENLQMALQDLQKTKTAYKADPRWNKRIAPQLDEISDAYSGLLERQHPENFDLFNRANETYRNVSILENAVENAAEGDIFNPRNLKTATKQGTTRFGGKKASARGDRPFNALVMPSLDVIPSKFDDASLAGRLATPAIAGGAGLGYGGVSLMAQQEQGGGQGNDQGEGNGVLPAPFAYGLGAAALSALPYSKLGTKAMSSMLRGNRSEGAQTLGALLERYSPAAFRGVDRGLNSEPGVPSPQGEAPLIDEQTQALIDQMAFSATPQAAETQQGSEKVGLNEILDKSTGRYVTKNEDGTYSDTLTGEPVPNPQFAHGGPVYSHFAYPIGR
jgi:hypothetical protein